MMWSRDLALSLIDIGASERKFSVLCVPLAGIRSRFKCTYCGQAKRIPSVCSDS